MPFVGLLVAAARAAPRSTRPPMKIAEASGAPVRVVAVLRLLAAAAAQELACARRELRGACELRVEARECFLGAVVQSRVARFAEPREEIDQLQIGRAHV